MFRNIGTGLLCLMLLSSGCLQSSTNMDDEVTEDGIQHEPCNGMVELCNRSYSDTTFPETHNSFATHADGIYYPASNHETGLQEQWDAGIRAFMLDAHYRTSISSDANDVRFCHGDPDRGTSPCHYGEVNAIAWLSHLRSLMANEENDVVTLLFESTVSAEHIEYLLIQSDLYDWIYQHELGEQWPTLAELIDTETRLVVFWEEPQDDAYPWLHDFLIFSWTTNFSENEPEEMNCEVHRGDGTQPIWHLNNWLKNSAGFSDPQRAGQVNDYDFLLDRGLECWEMHGKRPTFIAVDWWEDGDVVAVAQTLNEMEHWGDEIPS